MLERRLLLDAMNSLGITLDDERVEIIKLAEKELPKYDLEDPIEIRDAVGWLHFRFEGYKLWCWPKVLDFEAASRGYKRFLIECRGGREG